MSRLEVVDKVVEEESGGLATPMLELAEDVEFAIRETVESDIEETPVYEVAVVETTVLELEVE